MRRLATLAAIILVLGLYPVAGARAAAASAETTARVPVLLYHHVVPGEAQVPLEVGVASFARQMSYLRLRGYHFASMKEVEGFVTGANPLPDPTAAVTFDDGFEDNYTVAYPVLKRYGVRATIFVITSRIGTPGYLTVPEMHEMHASGLVEFQLHTDALHYKTDDGQSAVLAVPPDVLAADLGTARGRLAAFEGQTPDAFAYPFGFYNGAVAAPLAEAGVTAAFTVEPGYVRPGDNPMQLHRIPVFGTLRQRYLFRFIGSVEDLSFK